MTKEQLERALKVIDEDCTGTGHLLNRDGTTCALGGLLMTLPEEFHPTVDQLTPYYFQELALEREFGIPTWETNRIMELNDKWVSDQGKRKGAVKLSLRAMYRRHKED